MTQELIALLQHMKDHSRLDVRALALMIESAFETRKLGIIERAFQGMSELVLEYPQDQRVQSAYKEIDALQMSVMKEQPVFTW